MWISGAPGSTSHRNSYRSPDLSHELDGLLTIRLVRVRRHAGVGRAEMDRQNATLNEQVGGRPVHLDVFPVTGPLAQLPGQRVPSSAG